MRRIRLAEDPTIFLYPKGTRVAHRTSSGGPDPENRGTIVDGWVEVPSDGGAYGGSYYEVQRDDGKFFRAKELDLIRLCGRSEGAYVRKYLSESFAGWEIVEFHSAGQAGVRVQGWKF